MSVIILGLYIDYTSTHERIEGMKYLGYKVRLILAVSQLFLQNEKSVAFYASY